ncbi:hypothetical protein KUTeg_024496 [Tegillarca granosa]|uniref:Uncharacterized protein n=1 Tax=Tegillarca granosa TaxID=220873 RepID=A0ABQ9DYJ0_TEGGR|nr:hypothetical protein KUTeg_024496 [Tegillarca granosa]
MKLPSLMKIKPVICLDLGRCIANGRFCEVLNDINVTCNDITDTDSAGYKLLTIIKNTMSDKAATEKSSRFVRNIQSVNFILNWAHLSDQERSVNFTDVCAKALSKFESLYCENKDVQANAGDEMETTSRISESETVQLIRACSKDFAKEIDEKNGVYGHFSTYLKDKNDPFKFKRYSHNRFNIFFVFGQIVYYHRKNIKNTHAYTNRLVSSTDENIKVLCFVAGCRALGLHHSGGTLKKKSHISTISEKLETIMELLKKAKDDSTRLHHQNSAGIILSNFESSTTSKHNKLPKFFLVTDFLMKYRPNASTVCNESFLLFSHIETGKKLKDMSVGKCNKLINSC